MSQFLWKVSQIAVGAALIALLYWLSIGMPDQTGFLLAMSAFVFFAVCIFNYLASHAYDGAQRRRAGLSFIDWPRFRRWLLRVFLWWFGIMTATALLMWHRGPAAPPFILSLFVVVAAAIIIRGALAIITYKGPPKVAAPVTSGTDLPDEPDHDSHGSRVGWPEFQEPPKVLKIPAREQLRKAFRPPS